MRLYSEPPLDLAQLLPADGNCPNCHKSGVVQFFLQDENACEVIPQNRRGLFMGQGVSLVARALPHIEAPRFDRAPFAERPIISIGGYVSHNCPNGAVLAVKDHPEFYYGVGLAMNQWAQLRLRVQRKVAA